MTRFHDFCLVLAILLGFISIFLLTPWTRATGPITVTDKSVLSYQSGPHACTIWRC